MVLGAEWVAVVVPNIPEEDIIQQVYLELATVDNSLVKGMLMEVVELEVDTNLHHSTGEVGVDQEVCNNQSHAISALPAKRDLTVHTFTLIK